MMEPSPLNTPLSITIDRTVHLSHLSLDGSSPRRPTPGSRRPSWEPTVRSGHLSVDGSKRSSMKQAGAKRPSLQPWPVTRYGHASVDGSQSTGSSGSRRPSLEPTGSKRPSLEPPSILRLGHLSVDVGSRRPSQVSLLTPVTPTREQASASSPLQGAPDEGNGGAGAGPLREKIKKHESGRLSKARLPPWYYSG